MSIRVILADDHTIVLQGLSRYLQTQEGLEIVGQAKDGQTTVDLVRQLAPDVVVMDISMPILNGIEAARIIHQENPEVKVIGLSMHSSKRYIREMRDAGASGYLLKDCDFDELIEAIRTVAGGGTYFDPRIAAGTL
jgi:DNA-binding NarL/FixJ family response regulator